MSGGFYWNQDGLTQLRVFFNKHRCGLYLLLCDVFDAIKKVRGWKDCWSSPCGVPVTHSTFCFTFWEDNQYVSLYAIICWSWPHWLAESLTLFLLDCWPGPPAWSASWTPVCKVQQGKRPKRWQQSSHHRWRTEGSKKRQLSINRSTLWEGDVQHRCNNAGVVLGN